MDQRYGSDTHDYNNRSGRLRVPNRSKVELVHLKPDPNFSFESGTVMRHRGCGTAALRGFGQQNLRPGRNASSISGGQAEEERLPARASLRPAGETRTAASTDPLIRPLQRVGAVNAARQAFIVKERQR